MTDTTNAPRYAPGAHCSACCTAGRGSVAGCPHAPPAAPPEPAADADAQMAAIRRVMLSRHPILMAIYDAVQAVEKCGASTELTDAVILTGKLSEQAATLLDTIERQAIEIAARDTHLESFRIGIRERDATILRLQKSHTQAWNISVRDAALIEQQARELAERRKYDGERQQEWATAQIRAERAEADLAAARACIAAAGTDAARDVLAERARQFAVEGWNTTHDDDHDADELALAAACYAESATGRHKASAPAKWPWSLEWWKPTHTRRDLVKAGALILAEIERRDRVAARAAIKETK